MQIDRIIQKYLFLFLIFTLGIFLVYELFNYVQSALGALVFYILFKNLMIRLVERYKIKKPLAAVIILIITFVLVVLPIYFLMQMVINKALYYADNVKDFTTLLNYVQEQIARLPFKIKIEELFTNFSTWAGQFVRGLLSNVLNIFAVLGMMYFFLYFLLTNYGKTEQLVSKHIPLDNEKQLVLWQELKNMTISNAVGIPLIALAQGLCAWLLYAIAGVQDAGFWGVLTGIASIIPIVGTGLIWVPIVIVLFSMGNVWQAMVVLIGTILIMSNIDNVIRFIVFKRFADVHPIVTILGVLFGLSVFGLPGLVFGPLLISYFLILVGMFMTEYGTRKIDNTDLNPVTVQNIVVSETQVFQNFSDDDSSELGYSSSDQEDISEQESNQILRERPNNTHSPE